MENSNVQRAIGSLIKYWPLVFVGLLLFVLAPSLAKAGIIVFALGEVILETTSTGRKPDVSSTLTFLRPDLYPLDTILRRLDTRRGAMRAKAQKVQWEEMDVLPYADTKNGADTAGGAGASKAWVVNNGSYWKVDDIAYLPTDGTKLLVTDVVGNTVTVYKIGAVADETAFGIVPAIADTDPIIRMANAKEEYNLASESKAANKVQLYNYTQIFDAVLAISETRINTEDWSMHDYDANQLQHLFDLRRQMENATVFGQRALIADPTSARNRGFMGGIVSYLSTHDITYTAGSITESLLIDWMKQAGTGNNGSKRRIMACSPNLTAEIDKVLLASGTLQSFRDETILGVAATRIHTSFMDAYLVNNQGFVEYGKTNYGVIIDPANVRRRPLRAMKVKRVEENNRDGRARQWIEETTLEVRNEKTHAVIRDSATDTFS